MSHSEPSKVSDAFHIEVFLSVRTSVTAPPTTQPTAHQDEHDGQNLLDLATLTQHRSDALRAVGAWATITLVPLMEADGQRAPLTSPAAVSGSRSTVTYPALDFSDSEVEPSSPRAAPQTDTARRDNATAPEQGVRRSTLLFLEVGEASSSAYGLLHNGCLYSVETCRVASVTTGMVQLVEELRDEGAAEYKLMEKGV